MMTARVATPPLQPAPPSSCCPARGTRRTAWERGHSTGRSRSRGAMVSGSPAKSAGDHRVTRAIPFAAASGREKRRWKAPQPVGTMDRRAQGRGIRAKLHPGDRPGAQALDLRVHDARRGQRGLPLRERLDAGAHRDGKAAGTSSTSTAAANTEGSGMVPVYDGEGLATKGTRRRQLQLPCRCARVPRPSGALQGSALSRVRQLRPARPDRRGEVGARQHRCLRRNPSASRSPASRRAARACTT